MKNMFSIIRFYKVSIFVFLLFLISVAAAQKTSNSKLPQSLFIEIITTTDKFELNHSTEFMHADLPKPMHNLFFSFIKDSVAVEVPDVKNQVYYSFNLKNGEAINGDIYFNDTLSYIVFKIEDSKYVNYFTREGVEKIKAIFKL